MAISGLALADPVIKLVEQQVKDQGGILGGREVKFVRYDNRGSVAEAAAGAQKLMTDDKVSALTLGGISGAESHAISDFAEQNKILYVTYGDLSNTVGQKKYTLGATVGFPQFVSTIVNLGLKVIKPKTVGSLSIDLSDSHDRVKSYKEQLESAGAKTVYEEYVGPDTQDYMPYLTNIKSKQPDFLIIDITPSEPYMTIGKQMMELGGWGNTKAVGLPGAEQAKKMAGIQGMYVLVLWVRGDTYPGAVKFEEGYKAINGSTPSASQVYDYNCFWTAINAVDLAGTDTDLVKINEAAHSGNLEWDTPMGHAHYTAESGNLPGLMPRIAIVENNILVPVTIPD